MEGGDTWYYDTETDVHPMFNINGIADGSGDLATLQGQTTSFTEDMSFPYSGDNSYIDQISAIAPAFNIFQNSSPDYYAAVAHDAGGYRTIGSSFEFGGMADGTGVSTKTNLMEQYLIFFGIKKVNVAPDMPSGDDNVCPNSGNIPYSTNEVEGADFYYWTIEPVHMQEL